MLVSGATMRGWNVRPNVLRIWSGVPWPSVNELLTSLRPKVEVIHSGWYALVVAARCSVPNEKKLHMQMMLVMPLRRICRIAFCADDALKFVPVTGLTITFPFATVAPHAARRDVIGLSASGRDTGSSAVKGSSRIPNLHGASGLSV